MTPKWLIAALDELTFGVREIPGDADNPRIIEYHAATSLGASDDEVAWCSAFANWCMARAGIAGTNSAAARSWLTWGVPLAVPRAGCVAVFKRGLSAWQGHVGFYLGTTSAGNVVVLGGNQSDAVTVTTCQHGDLLGYRWPG